MPDTGDREVCGEADRSGLKIERSPGNVGSARRAQRRTVVEVPMSMSVTVVSVPARAAAPLSVSAGLVAARLAILVLAFATAHALHVPLFSGGAAAFAIVTAVGVSSLGLVALALRRSGRTFASLGWRTERPGRDVALGAAGFLAAAAVVLACGALFAGMGLADVRDGLVGPTMGQRALFVFIGIEAALSEESIFRGFLHGSLERRWGAAAALLFGALVFALYHLQLAPAALLGKIGLGLVFGALRLRSRSLVPSAIAHALVWAILGSL